VLEYDKLLAGEMVRRRSEYSLSLDWLTARAVNLVRLQIQLIIIKFIILIIAVTSMSTILVFSIVKSDQYHSWAM